MKPILYLILFPIILYSCHPQPHYGLTGIVFISAQVINPRDSIGVNDTVRVHFEVPDTILYNGVQTPINIDAAYVDLLFSKIDKAHAGSIAPATGSKIIASIGSLNPANNLALQKSGRKFVGEYLFLPKTRGVFFVEQDGDGYLSANNGQYTLNVKFNFGNINRNHQMLIDSAGTASNFNLFLQNHISNGWEIYGFKVN